MSSAPAGVGAEPRRTHCRLQSRTRAPTRVENAALRDCQTMDPQRCRSMQARLLAYFPASLHARLAGSGITSCCLRGLLRNSRGSLPTHGRACGEVQARIRCQVAPAPGYIMKTTS